MEDNWPMIGQFYKNCMDKQTIDSLGTQPITSLLNSIDTTMLSSTKKCANQCVSQLCLEVTLKTLLRDEVARLIGQLHRTGIKLFFGASGNVDLKDPGKVILTVSQGGLVRDPFFFSPLSMQSI